jgi:hypothetical protein
MSSEHVQGISCDSTQNPFSIVEVFGLEFPELLEGIETHVRRVKQLFPEAIRTFLVLSIHLVLEGEKEQIPYYDRIAFVALVLFVCDRAIRIFSLSIFLIRQSGGNLGFC